MPLRRVAPLFFVALCLGLSALVLGRQIIAHPKPPAAAAREEPLGPGEPSGPGERPYPGQPVDPKTWHVLTGRERSRVLNAVLGQLTALRAGDADKAMFYQSTGLRRNFRSAGEFERMIVAKYPEFGHSRTVQCGPVWTDPTGRFADVVVTVFGENGHTARGDYELVQEEVGYKVAGVEGGRAIN